MTYSQSGYVLTYPAQRDAVRVPRGTTMGLSSPSAVRSTLRMAWPAVSMMWRSVFIGSSHRKGIAVSGGTSYLHKRPNGQTRDGKYLAHRQLNNLTCEQRGVLVLAA